MKVLQQAIGKTVEVGGERSSGWIPSNASRPRPTPIEEVIFDVRILEADGGFILEWQSHNADYSNDTWHATVEEAKSQAMSQFGISSSEWQEID